MEYTKIMKITRGGSLMSKQHHTLKKFFLTTAALGTAMHIANRKINDAANAKNLLKQDEGFLYSFQYGNIFYKKSGTGTPILLVHDLNECSSGMEWFYLEKKLAKTNTVYTIDLLGCGRSAKPKMVYNDLLYVQLIADFIKEVIKEKTDVIATGHSAAPVIMAAKLNKDMIGHLTLINPTDLVTLKETPNRISKLEKALITCPVLGTFLYHITHTKDHIHEHFLNDYYSNPNSDFQEISEYYYESCHKHQSGSKYLYASITGNYLNIDISHVLKKLEQEILILSGEDFYEADYVPNEYAKLNEKIDCISILQTSYLPQLEEPSKVMEVLTEYWK